MRKLLFAVLLLQVTGSFTQEIESSGRVFSFPLKKYLDLSDAQVNQIIQLNTEYTELVGAKETRMGEIRVEIAMETGRERLDPMALGTRHVELETLRRQLAAEATRVHEKILAVLHDGQRAKLIDLEKAAKLAPLVSQAQCENLLPAPHDRPCAPSVPAGRVVPLPPPGSRLPVK